jgi:hypothetical protein
MEKRFTRNLAVFVALSAGAVAVSGRAYAQAPEVDGSSLARTIACDGADAAVNGNDNRIAFTGSCHGLAINGDGNRVQIALAPNARVAVAGHGNHVLYSSSGPGSEPNVALNGADNDVTASDHPPTGALVGVLPPAPPGPPTLTLPPPDAPGATGSGAIVLSADDASQTIDCAGRDVLIHGSNGNFRLLGGCRSISVQGQNDTIQAQLQPGARVLIGGPTVTLHYTLTTDGPPPVISDSAPGTTVTQVRHIDGGGTLSVPAGTPVVIAQPR